MIKRIFDLIAAMVGFFLLLPIFFVVALWIKVDSKGPVFYRQLRVGRGGALFRIHKFRTMKVNSDRAGLLTVGKDVRITRSGSFLRKSKVDELPQLLDVILGRMSLVGPRPEVEEYMQLYSPEVREKILSVRPGITDRASIEMVDENELLATYDDPKQAYIDVIMPIKAKYYCDYVDQQSLVEDIKVIFLTLRRILVR